ncbi:MAG: hypothetical protein F6K25_21620 [Okeania sp. SIO2G4]|uniref:hypothetical protein n=1 Tax=unclassified Okeania TaxID=2634635 RepID=UPI0013B87C1D|nr:MULTISPECIES: hypothetical protein [unclassified Okeania]NEP06497.1 hypothetical protein [Okeania sp. SIO4D6]NEP40527.1 hypothetical protein [Okeania sp. SIO2H7]NEP74309.1 hypothetical protein [Okeania sp. SIO2G5]NEP96425.1 hypothetical protein [Okeania sp. SIO2F5]NEQ93120.1 hypothetical protein [Okeania sp. SIO2G4]
MAAAREIITLVGRLPLALKIVGRALRTTPRTIADYANSLKNEQQLLKRLKVRENDELNVEASINLSLENLHKPLKNLFACLSVCAEDGFALLTAKATAGYKDEDALKDDLDELYNLSLLNSAGKGENRYVMHRLVFLVAKKRAQEWSVELKAINRLGNVGKLEEVRQVIEQEIENAQAINDQYSLDIWWNYLGELCQRAKNFNKINRKLLKSYTLAKNYQDKRGQIIISCFLIKAKGELGGKKSFTDAKRYFNNSIELGKELNDPWHLAKVHICWGQVLLAHKEFEQAVEELSQSFEIYCSLPNIGGLKTVTPNLTEALCKLGRREEALEYCGRALKIAPKQKSFLELRNKIMP